MDAFLIAHEGAVRLACFAGVFALVALLERLRPRRKASVPRLRRWIDNLSVSALGALAVRWALPLGEVAFAVWVAERGWGFFNQVHWPQWIEFALAVLALDFVIYWQHRLFHLVPWLWRLHLMHHADLDFDLTTGSRFHPLEFLLSAGIKLGAIALLGPAALAVLAFAVLLNVCAVFNHSNWHLGERLDRALRLLLVTPDMHRVHHSSLVEETNSNFGFNIPWWDRLFGSYRAQPALGHQQMQIGLAPLRDPKRLTLPWMLALPFLRIQARQS